MAADQILLQRLGQFPGGFVGQDDAEIGVEQGQGVGNALEDGGEQGVLSEQGVDRVEVFERDAELLADGPVEVGRLGVGAGAFRRKIQAQQATADVGGAHGNERRVGVQA